MIYLASPYSDLDPIVRRLRFEKTRRFTYIAIEQGAIIFSPIVYCHQFSVEFDAPTAAADWRDFNEWMMSRSEACWVLTLPGWEKSLGVQAEIDYFRAAGKSLEYKAPL